MSLLVLMKTLLAFVIQGTWGHTVFAKACKDAGKRPIFGVEIPFVIDTSFQKKQEVNDMSFLAKNNFWA